MESSLTLEDLANELAFTKIIYNGEIIFDDEDGYETSTSLMEMWNKYKNKIVYEMNVRVVHFHHCVLNIKGE